jgi:hypothetical protein
VDQDGYDDVMVGAILDSANGFAGGKVYLLSGKNGSEIFTVVGSKATGFLGLAVDRVGDVDGDRVSDFVVAGAGAPPFNTPSRVLSGKDGSILLSFDTLLAPNNGWICGAGDVNGDGCADLIVGEPQDNRIAFAAGRVRVLSIKKLSLTTTTPSVSISSGGTQDLRIDAGAEHAGSAYLVLGSMSGTKPEIGLGAFTLDLHPDTYTFFTLQQPNPLIPNALGVLDGSGKATAAFALPGRLISPAEHGRLLHHAFVLFGPAGITFTSNPLPVRLSE